MSDLVKTFFAENEGLYVYNGKAVIDLVFAFFYDDEDETDFDFTDDSGIYFFRIYDERLGREIKDLVPTRSANHLILNASVSDMTYSDNGKYFYELGYVRSGGYDEILRYGVLEVI